MKIEDNIDYYYLFMTSQKLNSNELNIWLIKRGCTSHVTKCFSIFSSIEISIEPKAKLGNSEIVQAKGI